MALFVVIGVPVLFFGFQWATATQKKLNEARAKDDNPGVIGGQVGHIIELNQVLDATDPGKSSRVPAAGAEDSGMIGRAQKARSAIVNASGAAMAEDAESLPVKPVAWSLDASSVEIPASRICGTISKSTFVANVSSLITGSSREVLLFSQGESPTDPDLGLFVYLRLAPGESIENRTWTISPAQQTGVPQVIKRWKVGTPAQLHQRAFSGGYAMKLQFGKIADGVMPGKIYVALPDPEHSVVSGRFQAAVRTAPR